MVTGAHVQHNPLPFYQDFNHGSVPDAGLWNPTGADSTQSTVASGQLQITHTATSQYNECDSRAQYNLTGQSTYINVQDAGNQALASHQTSFGVYADSSNKVYMTALNGNLQAYKVVAGVQTQVGSNVTYSSSTHAWWRIRESGGTTFWDTSTNGTVWTNQWSLANPITLTAVTCYAQSGCFSNEASGSHSYFNYWNLPLVCTTDDLKTFQTDVGLKVGIINIFQSWGSTDGSQNFVRSYMDAITINGSVPMITWEPWVAAGGPTQPTYQLSDITGGAYDSYITAFATDAAAWGKPFYMRFAHEMNGDWYPWSEQVNGNSAGQYATMWQHVYNLFTATCTTATWVWCPTTDYPGSTAVSGLYPGDSYVNWTGMDIYNWGTDSGHTWKTFSTVIDTTYANIRAATSAKPMMIAELGCSENGGNKASWLTSALTSEIYNYPAIMFFICFNENAASNWLIESSASAQEAYKQGLKYWLTQGKPGNEGRNLSVGNGMARSEMAN